MYWQQQEQEQQQQQQSRMRGRPNMQQALPGWGSPGIGGRPSLLDMSGNLRNDPGMRSPSFGPNQCPGPGPAHGGGLLPSPPMGMRSGRDMLGQLDNDIDELVHAKVRLQQAMLSTAVDGGPDHQQGFPQQQRTNMNQWHQSPQQNYQQQDRRRSTSGGLMGRNMRDGARDRGGQRGRPGMGNRERRGNDRGDSRGQNMQRKRSNSEIYDPARPTDDEVTSIGRPVDDLQVTIRQQSRGRAVIDEGGPARKKPLQSPRATSTRNPTAQAHAVKDVEDKTWFCHVCSVSCRNIKVYQTHMNGRKHLEAMDKIREVATFQSDQAKARLQAQNYLRKLEGGGGGGSVGRGGNARNPARNPAGEQRVSQRYCIDCHEYYKGDRFDHVKSDAHKDAKKKSKPHCNACNLSFKTTQKYVLHCKGELHKKRRDEQSQEGTSTEEENYVTVDAVGFDDDINLDAELIEMEMEAEEAVQGPETESEEQEQEVVILDSEDDKEPSDDAKADSAEDIEEVVPENQETVSDQPELEQTAEGEASAKEGADQASTSEPVDEPSLSEVPDVQIIESVTEQTSDGPAELEEGTANKVVALGAEGPDSESASGMTNLKVTLTFGNKPLSDLQSASAVPEVSLEAKVSDPNVSVGESKSVAVVGSGDQTLSDDGTEQVQSDQVGSFKVSGESGEEPSPMNVDPAPGVSDDPEQQPEIPKDQPEKQQKEKQQKEEIKELVFDPNTSVGEEYLVPTTGFFCKLCHKFLTSSKASRTHCKGKSHFLALKAELKKAKKPVEALDSNGQTDN